MGFRITANDGNGHISGDAISTYSYSEDVTSLDPSNVSGGTGQVNATALVVNGDKVGNTHPDSKLLINNKMSLVHTDSGEVQFTVKQVNKNIDVVSITGDTIQAQLNKEVTAGPHGGSGYTLLTALEYYCGLAGISQANSNLVFDGTLEADLDTIQLTLLAGAEIFGNISRCSVQQSAQAQLTMLALRLILI